ncbi:NADH-ubiquinone oxidoreductase-F iron-sulfur binding region domain-containing protein [Cryobacterium sp. 5I3]|uniref:NADH-ubiquinone oxidoreductase-F iron-sulfur binding region domain-containing protein n=1 Tax=Cryobacterium sp. 5I3 TaxID=3048592 RepID=UPI002B225C51|nr:NADH-ubiquinone oxidoreductase-F iron-sulfur binding region domain-containing protein [Cryobacterium sp. 5I3]MEB0200384.1 NADH-ubiquinone oxidoreductase-F iron-sulfur binding region domain-containing protein [Cryobacterium sp. 5I3]
MSSTADTRLFPAVQAPVGTARLTAAPAADYATHQSTFGPLPAQADSAALLAALRDSGLEGRGGAGFPAWRKLAAVPARERARRRRVVVIGNAAEGEPLSQKDATLLLRSPHLVIDGLLTVAGALGARSVYLYAQASVIESATRALAERADASAIELREAADTFISGEASAVVNALAGRAPIPQDRTVRLTESGLGGRPTLLHNVETLAHIALIARFGAAWFRSVGTTGDPGTRLVTVGSDGHPSRVLEVAGGSRIGDVLRFTGVDTGSLSAVLVGGYHGAWLPAYALEARLDRADLAGFGANPGAGILMGLGERRCPIAVAAAVASYLAGETAGQCGPCVNGLPAMAAVLGRLATGDRDPGLPGEVRRLAAIVTGRGSCNHPDGTARFVLSTLTVFADDVTAHLNGHCRKDHR